MTLNNATSIQDKAGVVVLNRINAAGTEQVAADREFIIYTGVSGNTLTGLTRNADGGSSDQDHAVGTIVEFVSDVLGFQGLLDHILTEHATDGTHSDITADSVVVTVADKDNTVGLTVTQNDTTNNPDAVLITNAGGGDGLQVTQTGNGRGIFVSNAGTKEGLQITQSGNGRGIFVSNAGTQDGLQVTQSEVLDSDQHAIRVYSNAAQTNASLVEFKNDNNSSDKEVLVLKNDGTGNGLFIDQNGNGKAIYIDSESTSVTVVDINTVCNNDVVPFSIKDAGNANAYFQVIRNTDITSEIVLRIGARYLWIDNTGDVRTGTYPTSDTGGVVVGSQS